MIEKRSSQNVNFMNEGFNFDFKIKEEFMKAGFDLEFSLMKIGLCLNKICSLVLDLWLEQSFLKKLAISNCLTDLLASSDAD